MTFIMYYYLFIVNKTEHLDFRKKKKKKKKTAKPWSKYNFDPLLKYTVDIFRSFRSRAPYNNDVRDKS